MKIYLTLKAIPELSGLPRNERRIVYYACRKHASGHWQTWAGTILGAVIGIAAGVAALYLVLNWSPFGRLINYFFGGFVCGALIVGITEYIRTIFVADQIRPYLREHLAARMETAPPPRRDTPVYEDSEV